MLDKRKKTLFGFEEYIGEEMFKFYVLNIFNLTVFFGKDVHYFKIFKITRLCGNLLKGVQYRHTKNM